MLASVCLALKGHVRADRDLVASTSTVSLAAANREHPETGSAAQRPLYSYYVQYSCCCPSCSLLSLSPSLCLLIHTHPVRVIREMIRTCRAYVSLALVVLSGPRRVPATWSADRPRRRSRQPRRHACPSNNGRRDGRSQPALLAVTVTVFRYGIYSGNTACFQVQVLMETICTTIMS